MEEQDDHFPVLGMQEFSAGKTPDSHVLFHELRGELLIEHPHKHDFFIMMLFEQGSGTHSIDFVEYPVNGGQLHVLFPEQVHQWKMTNTLAHQLMIGRAPFESFLPSLRFSTAFYQRHNVIDLAKEDYNALLYEFCAVRRLLEAKQVFRELVKARCTTIGLLISQAAEAVFKEADIFEAHPILSRFLPLIDRCYKTQRSVAFYANEIGISANYLNMVCKKQLQVPASTLIQDRVLLEAKRLLTASDMTVKEIVFDLGFYDHANFSKFFKTHTGLTPSEFKGLK